MASGTGVGLRAGALTAGLVLASTVAMSAHAVSAHAVSAHATSAHAMPAHAAPVTQAEVTQAEVTQAEGAPVTPPAQAARQAALVDQEDQRIIQIRAALAAMLQIGGRESAQWKQPQIFGSAHGKTMVLPERSTEEPYTIEDLRAVAGGRYVHRQADGSYVLGIHVFVADGAELLLESGARPLRIGMGSIPGAFSSIIGFGGTITIKGTKEKPVRIFSWNPATKRPDTDVTDGRAYIRAVGGEFTMDHAQVAHLGFWSGRTGGIALTGTDRPASAAKHRSKEQRHADKLERLRKKRDGQAAGGGAGDVQVDPAGEDGQGNNGEGTASHVPAEDLVTGLIRDSAVSGNAYGAFISGSNQTQIVRNTIRNSLVNGVLMHRFAKNANIENTTVTGSGGDGFVLSRATEKVRVTGCVAENNGRNGFTLNGQALADGPSASGESLQSFGDSSVNRSVARNNRRYGIELLGGDRLAVQSSQIVGGDMGIVVRAAATGVQLSGNTLTGQARHGIALRDGVTGADVAGNKVTGAVSGIYLRNASATVVGNTVRTARVHGAHGVALKGDVGGTRITSNTIGGAGTSAVRVSGSHGRVVKENNDTGGWRDTSSLWMKVQRVVKPMNVIWACVFLLVLVSAFRSRGDATRGAGDPAGRRGGHPYDLQRRLEHRPTQVLQRRHWGAARPGPGPHHSQHPAAAHGQHHAAPHHGQQQGHQHGQQSGHQHGHQQGHQHGHQHGQHQGSMATATDGRSGPT